MVALLLALALAAEVAPMPRLKVDPACKACANDDARCRARAALTLHSASVAVPKVMPSAERMAAKVALERADKAIKATPKAPVQRP